MKLLLYAIAMVFLFQDATATRRDQARPASPASSLSDYEGVYAYHGGTTIAIVAAPPNLFAVLDDAKYPLRPLDTDRFVNVSGDTIPFKRGADGQVTGFEERGVFYARRSSVIDPATAAIVRAVARPADGRRTFTYAVPSDVSDGLAVAHIKDAGLDTATVTRLVDRVVDGTYRDVHSILVYRRGRLVVEEYFYGFDRDRPHQMRSATKSIVSALVGIAIDRGALSGDGELVKPRLPYEQFANPDPRKDRLTLRDLLTMRSGLACDDWDGASPGNESNMYPSPDWVKFVLDLPMIDAPGTRGRYCSGNVIVAGTMVERATGTRLPAFAQEHLFAPLGIRAEQFRWNFTLDATNLSVSQLYMRPRDMLKIGILFMQRGLWNGRQVISREWVERSTRQWTTIGDQGYGYFWWHQWTNASTESGPRRVDMVVATGNGGQKIYMVPSLDAVVVMTGGNYNSSSPAMKIMANELLPALLKASAAPSD